MHPTVNSKGRGMMDKNHRLKTVIGNGAPQNI